MGNYKITLNLRNISDKSLNVCAMVYGVPFKIKTNYIISENNKSKWQNYKINVCGNRNCQTSSSNECMPNEN